MVPPEAGSHPSLLLFEAAATLAVVLLSFSIPHAGSAFFARAERWGGRLAARRNLSVAAVGAAAVLLRLGMLPLAPPPQPYVHDEFSHLLAADTFAQGRLANPVHPMRAYFETFHVNQAPAYASMYFPAQGLVLAAGKLLAGQPWFGVCLSAALMCSAICWMAQGWLPPGWALLGGVLAVLRLALFSYWGNSYYGGAVPAIGGALVLGAYARLRQKATWSGFGVLGAGAAVLMLSRPWEGLLVCAPAVGALAWRAIREKNRLSVWPSAAALAMIAGGALAFLAYYDYRLTGSAVATPYQLNRSTYATAPAFLWLPARSAPAYRYRMLQRFYTENEMAEYRQGETVGGFAGKTAKKLGAGLFFFLGVALFPAAVMLRRVSLDRRVRFLVMTSIVFGVGISWNTFLLTHYFAPLTAAVYVLLLQALRHWRHCRPGGLFVVRWLVVVCVALAVLRLLAGSAGIAVDRSPAMWYGSAPLGLPRASVLARLDAAPGRQLAIVRYAPEHDPLDEWVYNEAGIDGAQVVWAREDDSGHVGTDLLQYFRDRQAWLIEPDANPPRISSYAGHR